MLHLFLELRAELIPITLVLSMDEKGSKQVDVLDIQPAAAARELIAATVFEWQSGLHKTILARFLPPIEPCCGWLEGGTVHVNRFAITVEKLCPFFCPYM
jgi:hypothetical protein